MPEALLQLIADLFAKAQAEVSPRDRIELFEGIVSRFPNDKSAVQAAFMIGFTYSEELKDYPAARKAFEKFIREHPDSDLVSSAKWMLANMGTGATPPGLGPMGEGPPGTYTVNVPSLQPNHGPATVSIEYSMWLPR